MAGLAFNSIKFASTYLYTWMERGPVKAKRIAQEHNTMFPPRARTQTPRSGVKCTNHNADLTPWHGKLQLDYLFINMHGFWAYKV